MPQMLTAVLKMYQGKIAQRNGEQIPSANGHTHSSEGLENVMLCGAWLWEQNSTSTLEK